MERNRDYVVRSSEDGNEEGRPRGRAIVPVDYGNTGRVHPGTRWNCGLHELLEVKEGLVPKTESLTAASMSHPSFFIKYATLYGVTGTMGVDVERAEVGITFGLTSFDVPPHVPSARTQLDPVVAATRDKHIAALLQEVRDVATRQRRPILLLFEFIADAQAFSTALTAQGTAHLQLTEEQAESEEFIVQRAARPGAVTVATNTAGRGTDIRLDHAVAALGGLHVVFTFMPPSERVEDQGFGRAGRQGQRGTCRLILLHPLQSMGLLGTLLGPRALGGDPVAVVAALRDARAERTRNTSVRRSAMVQGEVLKGLLLEEFFQELGCLRTALERAKVEDRFGAWAQVLRLSSQAAVVAVEHPTDSDQASRESRLSATAASAVLATGEGRGLCRALWLQTTSAQESGDVPGTVSRLAHVYLGAVVYQWALFFTDMDRHMDHRGVDPTDLVEATAAAEGDTEAGGDGSKGTLERMRRAWVSRTYAQFPLARVAVDADHAEATCLQAIRVAVCRMAAPQGDSHL